MLLGNLTNLQIVDAKAKVLNLFPKFEYFFSCFLISDLVLLLHGSNPQLRHSMLDHVQRAMAVANLHDHRIYDPLCHPSHPDSRLLHHHRVHHLEQGQGDVGEFFK